MFGAPTELEDDVEGPVVAEILRIDRRRPERRHLVAQVGVADGGHHRRPRGDGQLDAGEADAPGGSVHADPLAHRQRPRTG